MEGSSADADRTGVSPVPRGAGIAGAFARAFRPPSNWIVFLACALAAIVAAVRWIALYEGLHPDSMLFYSAARLALDGNAVAIFDPQGLTAYVNSMFFPGESVGWFRLAPWLYPPVFLLAVVPFGVLPFGWFYLLFQLATAIAAAAAVGWGRGGVGRLGALALLASPAAVINLVVGQNAFLTLALLVGGFRLLPYRPILAGALLGALVYKPQLCPLVPVALVAARQWRALAAAAASATVLCAASAAAFGIDAWSAWLTEIIHPPGDFSARWFLDSIMLGFGVLTCALRLGAPPMLALGAQLFAAAVAIVAVYRAYRAGAPWDLGLALLLCGTALVTPHIAPYDLALAAAAVVIVFVRSRATTFMAGEAVAMALLWALPLARPLDNVFGRFAPIWIALMAAYAIAKTTATEGGLKRPAQ